MKKNILLLSLLINLSVGSFCQVHDSNMDSTNNQPPVQKDRDMFGLYTPRGLKMNTEGLANGFVMFAVPNSPFVYLINRRGEVVHQWKGNYGAFNAYLMNDGSIVQGADDPDYPTFGFGGPYGRLQKIAWNGKMLWDFEYASENQIIHHDFAVMPNGHTLAIAYETKSYNDALARGRKSELTPKDGPWLEKIIEIEPQDDTHGKIVWEWHLWDHLIQDRDASKAGYGKPVDHPELLDFNLGIPLPPLISQDSVDALKAIGMEGRNSTAGNRGADIFHFNAIKYNPEMDQIVFSSPNLSEIFIVDHSTNSMEAASHKGGHRGKGGDFLYRWGNPQNYQRGNSNNRKLFGQHDIRWVENGKPGAGNLIVFNNHPPGEIEFQLMGNDSKNFSAIYEFISPVDKSGNYGIEENKSYGPENAAWMYVAKDTFSFWSSFISGAHRMDNGNTFINEGAKGKFFEVTPDGKVVWEYLNPYRGEIRKTNGDPISPMFMPYSTFRATFIPANHTGLINKKLEAMMPQPLPFFLPPPPVKAKL